MRAWVGSVVVLMLVTGAVQADEWTVTDTVLETVALSTLFVDYLQTRQIVDDHLETNPLIDLCGGRTSLGGECSGIGMSPEAYFTSVAVLHIITMRLLPSKLRNLAQGITIGVQFQAIRANYAWGYKIHF